MLLPPSTTRHSPVTKSQSIMATTAWAIWSGVATELSGVLAARLSSCSRATSSPNAARYQRLLTNPGATALTRTSGASAEARLRASCIRAAVETEYGIDEPEARRPAIEVTLTMAPPVSRRLGAAALEQ